MSRKPALSLHRRIIRDALEIAWHHKHLWVFGFFATFIGFGGVGETLFNAFTASADGAMWRPAMLGANGFVPGYATVRTVASFSPFPALAMLLFFAAAALCGAIFAWITVTSSAALLSGSRKIARGGEPHFSDGVKVGAEKFWPLLGVIAACGAVVCLALGITGGNLAASMRAGGLQSLFFIGAFALGTVIAFFAALTAVYGSAEVIANDAPVSKALRDGFLTAQTHWFVNLEMAALLSLTGLAVGIAVMAAALVCTVPLIFLMAVASTFGSQGMVIGILTLTAVILLVLAAALGSFVTTFQVAAWTMLWDELDAKPLPKILRWIGLTSRKSR